MINIYQFAKDWDHQRQVFLTHVWIFTRALNTEDYGSFTRPRNLAVK